MYFWMKTTRLLYPPESGDSFVYVICPFLVPRAAPTFIQCFPAICWTYSIAALIQNFLEKGVIATDGERDHLGCSPNRLKCFQLRRLVLIVAKEVVRNCSAAGDVFHGAQIGRVIQ